ncbi:MAG: nucleotidyltransferase domain-containing protein [bacterium]
MAQDRVYEAIGFLEQCLRERGLTISKIILFGSQAKGRATEESDVDIAIISEDFSNKDIFERAILTKDAEIMTMKKFMLPLDIITMTTKELESGTSIMSEYVRDGEVVMERV